jgi:hypothetical protein
METTNKKSSQYVCTFGCCLLSCVVGSLREGMPCAGNLEGDVRTVRWICDGDGVMCAVRVRGVVHMRDA